jgi:hypothetical protein
MPQGRPSKYKEEHDEQAFKLSLLGATDEQLADFFNVAVSTVNLWKENHPSFSESIKRGKQVADAEVANSLYRRALGYSHPEDKIFNNAGEEMVVQTTKHYPPDTTAAIFWLKNRQKAQWRDRTEKEVSGPNGGPIEHNATVITSEMDAETAARLYQQAINGLSES